MESYSFSPISGSNSQVASPTPTSPSSFKEDEILSILPNEIVNLIFSNLGSRALTSVLLTCKTWKKLGSADSLWKKFLTNLTVELNPLELNQTYHQFFNKLFKEAKNTKGANYTSFFQDDDVKVFLNGMYARFNSVKYNNENTRYNDDKRKTEIKKIMELLNKNYLSQPLTFEKIDLVIKKSIEKIPLQKEYSPSKTFQKLFNDMDKVLEKNEDFKNIQVSLMRDFNHKFNSLNSPSSTNQGKMEEDTNQSTEETNPKAEQSQSQSEDKSIKAVIKNISAKFASLFRK